MRNKKNHAIIFGVIAVTILVLAIFFTEFEEPPAMDGDNHIHAIAFDPTEEGAIYVGTHHTLEYHQGEIMEERGMPGTDYMGFIISADGSFYSSGHTSQVGDVGIRKSMDKGNTWETLEYEGKDFHDMAVGYADPDTIYAWSTPPEPFLTISRDKGASWTIVEPQGIEESIFFLSADHQQAGKLYAGTLYGLYTSEDYGNSWTLIQSMINVTTVSIADDPQKEGVMYASVAKKGLIKTTNDGASWEDFNDGLPSASEDIVALIAVNPNNPQELYVMTKTGRIFRHEGNKWEEFHLTEAGGHGTT